MSRSTAMLALALATGLAGCTRTVSLGARFVGVDARVRGFEVWLVEGGSCEADADALAGMLLGGVPDDARHAVFRDPSSTSLFASIEDTPSRLLVLFRDEACRPIQVGCTAFEPSDVDSVEVVARAVTATLDGCGSSGCSMGLCEGSSTECELDSECGGPFRCTSRACTSVPLERASGLMRPGVGADFDDELALLATPEGGDMDYVMQYVGVVERARSGGTTEAQVWSLHERDADPTVLEVDTRRPNPAVPAVCRDREEPRRFPTDRVFEGGHHLALGGRVWPLFGVLGTAEGDPAMAMGLPLAYDMFEQGCDLRTGVTVRGPVVRAGDEDGAGRYSAYVWVEVDEGGTAYLTRYEWNGRIGRVELPATTLDGIGAAGTHEGFHVVYELAPDGPVMMWDSANATAGVELTRPGASGPPALGARSATDYVLGYSVTSEADPSDEVILREVSCAPSCDYTGTEARVVGRFEHVRLAHLQDGGFAMAALDVLANRIVVGFFDDALRPLRVDGAPWVELRDVPAGSEVRALRLATATDCVVAPARGRVSVATLIGPSGGGAATRVDVDLLRYPTLGCP